MKQNTTYALNKRQTEKDNKTNYTFYFTPFTTSGQETELAIFLQPGAHTFGDYIGPTISHMYTTFGDRCYSSFTCFSSRSIIMGTRRQGQQGQFPSPGKLILSLIINHLNRSTHRRSSRLLDASLSDTFHLNTATC